MFVKICGITAEDDALLAVALGADAVGFIFAPSKRQVRPAQAAEIARRLPLEILTVGVFRDETKERVVEIINSTGLRAAQLHGHESAEDCRWIRERVPATIRALPAGSPDLDRFDEFGADVLLLDSPTPGSGQVFDWSLAEGRPSNRRTLLAGGLNPDNVVDAITRIRPWGVDVASGVEREPGRKDPTKLREFIVAAQSVPPLPEHEALGDAPYNWLEDDPSQW